MTKPLLLRFADIRDDELRAVLWSFAYFLPAGAWETKTLLFIEE
jgi:hypothetical protein